MLIVCRALKYLFLLLVGIVCVKAALMGWLFVPIWLRAPTDFNHLGEGLRKYEDGGRKGLQNLAGRRITEPKYDFIFVFRDGRARVAMRQPRSTGFIDKDGREVVPLMYVTAGEFSEGLAWVQTAACIPWSPSFPKYLSKVEYCRTGYVSREGRLVVRPRFHGASDFSCGRAAVDVVRLSPSPHLLGGIIDHHGAFVVPPTRALSFSAYSSCIAAFQNLDSGKSGFVDRSGATLAPAVYDHVYPFQGSFAIVQRGPFYGAVGRDGRLVVPAEFTDVAGPGNQSARLLSSSRQVTVHSDGRIVEHSGLERLAYDLQWPFIAFVLWPMTFGPP